MFQRIFDLVLAIIALVAFLPFGLTIMTLLRFTGEREVFYVQERVGRNRRPFYVYKFATMLRDSPRLGAGDITLKQDSRVLPVGRFLRKTKLNEIPQLFNVVMGTMGIVGPRPLTRKTFSYYSEDIQDFITQMRPGLTGIGSIVFRDEERLLGASPKPFEQCYKEDIAPYKGQLEKWYYDKRGISINILIMLVTLWVVIRPRSTIYRRIWSDLPGKPRDLHIDITGRLGDENGHIPNE